MRPGRRALPGLLLAAALCSAPPLVAAPADTALAREVTAEVNGALARLERSAFTAQLGGVAYKSQVRAWRDATGVRKVEVTDADDSGSVVTEYYFRGADDPEYRDEARRRLEAAQFYREAAGLAFRKGKTP